MTVSEGPASAGVELDDVLRDVDDPFLPPPPPPRPTFVAELPTTPLAEGKLAYHQGDYARAAEQLQAVVASPDYDDESKVTAAYWRAEAQLRQDMSPAAVGQFRAVADAYAGHHLASAALTRADALQIHFDIISGSDD